MLRPLAMRAVVAGVALSLVACREPIDAAGGRITAVAPRPAISDGATGANPHFFFLPPMVAAPSYSGVSDGGQSPTVVVCEWVDGACGQVVARFERGDESSPDAIRYDAATEQYQVNWKTTQCTWGPCTLDPDRRYRLRVLVGTFQLGFADLDVVATGAELRHVQTGEYIGLLDGRTLPVKFRLEQGAIPVVPPGYTIVFSAQPLTGEYNDIFTQRTDGGDASRVRLTTDPADDQAPRYSPDARRILFTSQGAHGSWELFVMDATPGAARRQVTNIGGITAYGDLSPTNPSLAVFMSSYRIWTMNIDAADPWSTAVRLTDAGMDENHPRWSPDGRWIAFVRQPRAGTDLWILDAADPTRQYQVSDLGDYARYPAWSPDGTKIVFERLYDLYVADVIDATDPAHPFVRPLSDVRITRLTFDGAWNDMPAWSPDGRKIVWVNKSDPSGHNDLYMMNPDGTGVERLSNTPDIEEQWPSFRPAVP